MIPAVLIWLIGVSFGILIGIMIPPAVEAFKRLQAENRKYVCDGCKTKVRRKNGYSPVPVDLEVNDSLVPVNLIFCRNCVPPHA